jgi:hypothetical protein
MTASAAPRARRAIAGRRIPIDVLLWKIRGLETHGRNFIEQLSKPLALSAILACQPAIKQPIVKGLVLSGRDDRASSLLSGERRPIVLVAAIDFHERVFQAAVLDPESREVV